MIDMNSIKNGKLINGDAINKLKRIPSNSIDVVVTDPPYGYAFMGKNWDKVLPDIEIFEECLRVLKPGAFAFVMAAPRQDVLSRMMIKLEDAGFKTDFTSIYWTYATGFPKANNIGKAIDKKFDKEREIIGTRKQHDIRNNGYASKKSEFVEKIKGGPVSQEAKQFEGAYGGFQPKPAVEIIIVVQKPGTHRTQCVQALDNGKGVTWLDDCRIPYSDGDTSSAGNRTATFGTQETISGGDDSGCWEMCKEGRFPANLLVSNDVLNGGYSRFFSLDAWTQRNHPFLIVPKATKKEKDAGCENLREHKIVSMATCNGTSGKPSSITKGRNTTRKNNHPTVKPIELMSYFITMGSREGDFVLDPFCGSGTTLLAARLLGRKFIGIELEKEYYDIAYERLQNVSGAIQKPGTPASGKVQRLSDFESFELQTQGGPIIDVSGGKGLVEAINFALNNPSTASMEVHGFKITGVKKQNFEQQKEPDNVQDWADKGINISRGCINNCRYCYAREESVRRHGNTVENWPKEELNPKVINKGWRTSSKRLMFPTTHDITPGTYDACETVLKKLLKAGNKVLVVSKPRPELIEKLCNAIMAYKNQVMFRFTITAMDNEVLGFWEPNAPTYENRKKALALVKEKGFRTSVSIEPMLDSPNVGALIEDLRPHTTDCMWVGPMKMVRKRVVNDSPGVEKEIVKIISDQTSEKLLPIYTRYKDDPMIKWKEHYRKQLRKLGIKIPPKKDDWRDRIPK